MVSLFDENGVVIPPAPVTQAEKDAMLAYARLVYPVQKPDKEGLPLSALRVPQSKVSLQRTEQVAKALVDEGLLRSVNVPAARGGWVVYHLVGV